MEWSSLEMNIEHVWGRYYELRISPTCIQRTIFLEEGGTNSLHRHQTEEWMTVVAGCVRFSVGEDPDSISTRVFNPGDSIHIPKLHWHNISYSAGDVRIDGIRCAVINEVMLGEHFDGEYLIERHVPAKPSVRHRGGG